MKFVLAALVACMVGLGRADATVVFTFDGTSQEGPWTIPVHFAIGFHESALGTGTSFQYHYGVEQIPPGPSPPDFGALQFMQFMAPGAGVDFSYDMSTWVNQAESCGVDPPDTFECSLLGSISVSVSWDGVHGNPSGYWEQHVMYFDEDLLVTFGNGYVSGYMGRGPGGCEACTFAGPLTNPHFPVPEPGSPLPMMFIAGILAATMLRMRHSQLSEAGLVVYAPVALGPAV